MEWKHDSGVLASCLADIAAASDVIRYPCPHFLGDGDRYRLSEVLAMGRRSVVYRGDDTTDGHNEPVAIKVARAAWTRGEVSGTERIGHEGVIRLRGRGVTAEGHAFAVFDLVDSSPRDLSMIDAPWPPLRAARLIRDLAEAVEATHRAGLIHRDIKPSNVLLRADGSPVLADFDLAAGIGEEGVACGTVAFAAPEQLEGLPGSVAPAADVFALGGVLSWILAGRPPRPRLGAAATVDPMVGPDELRTICVRAMAPDPGRRWRSAAQMGVSLTRWLRRVHRG